MPMDTPEWDAPRHHPNLSRMPVLPAALTLWSASIFYLLKRFTFLANTYANSKTMGKLTLDVEPAPSNQKVLLI